MLLRWHLLPPLLSLSLMRTKQRPRQIISGFLSSAWQLAQFLALLLGLFTRLFTLQQMRLPRAQWVLAPVQQLLHCMRAFSSPLINNRGV
nr:MAG TPA: hypothetical protein [Bacteriophage sp.]